MLRPRYYDALLLIWLKRFKYRERFICDIFSWNTYVANQIDMQNSWGVASVILISFLTRFTLFDWVSGTLSHSAKHNTSATLRWFLFLTKHAGFLGGHGFIPVHLTWWCQAVTNWESLTYLSLAWFYLNQKLISVFEIPLYILWGKCLLSILWKSTT